MAKEKLLAADSSSTIRTKSMTGKYARFLRSQWTEEWDRKDTPEPLKTPLQGILAYNYLRRIDRGVKASGVTAESGAYQLYTYPTGQGVGEQNTIRTARDVVRDMATGYIDAIAILSEQIVYGDD